METSVHLDLFLDALKDRKKKEKRKKMDKFKKALLSWKVALTAMGGGVAGWGLAYVLGPKDLTGVWALGIAGAVVGVTSVVRALADSVE